MFELMSSVKTHQFTGSSMSSQSESLSYKLVLSLCCKRRELCKFDDISGAQGLLDITGQLEKRGHTYLSSSFSFARQTEISNHFVTNRYQHHSGNWGLILAVQAEYWKYALL
jgi:hypothetical protein